MEEKPKRTWVWVSVVVLALLIVGGGLFYYLRFVKEKPDDNTATTAGPTNSTDSATSDSTTKSWQEKGVAIAGQFADAEVIDLGNGTWRMYYSVEPEVPGNNLEVYSATSTDGVTWTKESGTRKEMATFPDLIKLPSGQFRMYFQNAGVIKSALSSDGLVFVDEPGTRIDKNETGYNLENVGAQTTTQLQDGTYIMAYRGMINQPYGGSQMVPNNNTQIYFYATSPDGLNFTKKGLALDSRNDTLYGLADGGEWVKWDTELRLSFWSYTGVYHITYTDGAFSTSPVFDFTNNKDTKVKFAPNPPGDPTFAKINNQWFMYYGQHTQGIYYAEYME